MWNCVNDWAWLVQNWQNIKIHLRLWITAVWREAARSKVPVECVVYLQSHSNCSGITRRKDGDFQETIQSGQTCILWGQLCWTLWENLSAAKNHIGPHSWISDVSRGCDHLWCDLVTYLKIYCKKGLIFN